MASFRARVLLLSLGMITLICIQIYRTHFETVPIFYDSQEDIDYFSKREVSGKRHFQRYGLPEKPIEALQATVKSTDISYSGDSQIPWEQSLDKENTDIEDNSFQLPKNKKHGPHTSDVQHQSLHVSNYFNDTKLRHGAQEYFSEYSSIIKNLPVIKNNYSESRLHRTPGQSYPEIQRKNKSEEMKATTSSSWFATGELGPDYDFYNISWRRLTPITDNFTIDISRYMNGRPVYRAPIMAHNRHLCDVGGSGLFLLVIIPSLPRHHEMRTVIRETWASPVYNGGLWAGRKLNESIRLTFIFGATNYTDDDKAILRTEMRKFGDILVMDFVDSYQNLSTKMVNSFYWAGKYCQGVRHLVKVDEDTYVHLPQLINMIKRVEKITDRFILGHQHNHHFPKVVRKGRWRVGLEYPLPYYPRYIYGHSYVISGAALPDILRTLKTTPGIKNEDAFITGIVAKLTNIPRFHTRAFAGTSYQQVLCNITRGYYVSLTFCCKEHLRTLYRHAVEGKCDKSRFHQIPSWKCRFFRHDLSHHSHRHAHHEINKHTSTNEKKEQVKKLEHLFNVGAGLIGGMGKKYLKEDEVENGEVKNIKALSVDLEANNGQREIEKLEKDTGKDTQENFKEPEHVRDHLN